MFNSAKKKMATTVEISTVIDCEQSPTLLNWQKTRRFIGLSEQIMKYLEWDIRNVINFEIHSVKNLN